MPIEIKIHTFFDPERSERAQLEASLEALGFVRQVATLHDKSESTGDKFKAAVQEFISNADFTADAHDATTDIIADQQADVEQAKAATRRERGKPGEGRARRTKAEIAEDEAADAADASWNAAKEIFTEGNAQSISTGEERVSPDDAEDAEDEAEETARTGDGTLTHDDLRRALGTLGIKAGVAAVKEGGLLGMTVDKVPTDQIGAMIAKIEAAKAGGETAPVEDKPAEAAPMFPGTKDGLMKAMLAYAKKYDGTDVMGPNYMTEMPAMNTDCPKILGSALGAGFNSFSKVPADRYEEAVAAVAAAIVGNPFEREAK